MVFVYIDRRCVFIYFIRVYKLHLFGRSSLGKRQPNFIGEEVELLVSEVEKREILFGKLAPGLSSAVKDAK